uniref:hypothetical protein n=1 Tax=Serratia quinivorans TaxID=137545 RepID=UPI0035C67795
MDQRFKGDVGNVAGRDVINISLPPEPPGPKKDEVLATSQRLHINGLITNIVNEGKKKGETDEQYVERRKKIWRLLHAHLGVECVNEMKKSQFDKAITYLSGLAAEVKESKRCGTLIKKILNNDAGRKSFHEYCIAQFGTTQLTELNITQLQQVLNRTPPIPPKAT